MHSIGNPFLWSCFTVIVVIMLVIDLRLQGSRGSAGMSFKQAACWSVVWVLVSLLFSAVLWGYLRTTVSPDIASSQTLAFITGYLLEKALAVDNVFVWLMLFSYFSIPASLRQRVLVYGVLGAIVLRTAMIFAGSWLVNEFSWILCLFGAFLVFTGIKMAIPEKSAAGSSAEKPLVSWLSRHLRVTETLQGERFFVRRQGVLRATPLLLVLIMVELSDVIFAVDSIPAIFAVTTDPFIVLTSNLFAILGLRAMYFMLSGIAERFSLLKYGLALILLFIGVKMLLMEIVHIPVTVSLTVIATILLLTLLLNHWVNCRTSQKP
ncbi:MULTISPECIES: TerC family protein [Tatumella]|uniref:TerC family protein n=1 Tax=Tatumella punctata TaxID=399969 RepID=A0ABW1VMI9_9GAMM|nr:MULTISPECIES: TerC family protein [unclassified Tatumella]MBS0876774.1 TerC family protein [Tatumella sp. JGM82]MBS0889801.1 TerC family protein [Tatumella sp. JGM94]MBS0892879.1 TerC family protein [Tatumella sp. JGM130]MBS0901529.1 TerC family protein [Tatumella sp. JGM100]